MCECLKSLKWKGRKANETNESNAQMRRLQTSLVAAAGETDWPADKTAISFNFDLIVDGKRYLTSF